MKCLVLLTVFTLVSSTPLLGVGRNLNPIYATDDVLIEESIRGTLGSENVAQTLSFVVEGLLRKAEARTLGLGAAFGATEAVARETAEEIVRAIVEAQKARIVGNIRELELLLGRGELVGVTIAKQKIEGGIAEAIRQLGRALQRVQTAEFTGQEPLAKEQLKRTLKTLIQADLITTKTKPLDRTTGTFKTKVKKMINEGIIREIQKIILKKQKTIEQLQQQKQLIQEQKEQLRSRLVLGPLVAQELLQVKLQLEREEERVLQEETGGQLVIERLQKDLIEQQRELEQQTVMEQVKEGMGNTLMVGLM